MGKVRNCFGLRHFDNLPSSMLKIRFRAGATSRWVLGPAPPKRYGSGSATLFLTIKQCCGAGPFLCGSGSTLSKISALAPAPACQKFRLQLRPFSPYIFEKNQKFSWFQKNFMLLKTKNDH
jgi:hypothetical protein